MSLGRPDLGESRYGEAKLYLEERGIILYFSTTGICADLPFLSCWGHWKTISCIDFMAAGLVTRAILLGDKASLEGVTLRFLEDDRGELLAAILSTMTSVAE